MVEDGLTDCLREQNHQAMGLADRRTGKAGKVRGSTAG